MSEYDNVRIGLFGIGLAAYWPQFAGLEERLRGYVDEVGQRVERPGVELVNLGLIDDPEKAMAAGHDFRRADVDLILLYVTTYALSSTVLPVVQRAKVPVLILNVQPVRALDYAAFNAIGDRTEMTGEKLAHVSVCPVPEIANVFSRAGIPFYQVTGTLEADDPCWAEVDDWIDAARVANALFHNRLGLMGHYYNGMLDIHSDVTGLLVAFGGHAEIVEVDELSALRRQVTDDGGLRADGGVRRGIRYSRGLHAAGVGAGGAHVRGAGPARGASPAGCAGLLCDGKRQCGERGHHEFGDPGQFAVDGAGCAGGGRV